MRANPVGFRDTGAPSCFPNNTINSPAVQGAARPRREYWCLGGGVLVHRRQCRPQRRRDEDRTGAAALAVDRGLTTVAAWLKVPSAQLSSFRDSNTGEVNQAQKSFVPRGGFCRQDLPN